ncbi:DNA-binding SARP family transcriptional activator/RecA/RadA recombinase [Allocatelliglobosispora scoriae]|uniref:DNA-binding SARP family transcriptional activator/RecA/RadA recombinase n=1 Tax=Allocatelliglobosispora scoriae TaxID=643052 RepID=A0A841BL73_9ACTN|nr:BTAD domain-containing putative transcriptional regulator [Allocatelliglobosispora scoriae]MBB5867996.1 DNA-binding SARP family transcriptional activator/RecA/RadA recombinase [Allocatelliglobosispora scoriae]
MATYHVLGSLTVTADQRPVPVRSRRQRAVLATLLANPRSVTPVDRLLRALWADDPPDTAIGQVQTVVWRLRQALGDGAILTRPGGYELVAAESDVDADVFAATAAHAAELAERGQLAQAAERYTEALRLWRGRPFADVQMPGDLVGSGLPAAIAALTEHRVAVESRFFDVELALGRHEGLVPLLDRRVQEEPLREGPRERLMLALYRCGRRADALEAYRQGRAVLVRELGLEPGPGLQQLNARILAGDPRLASAAEQPGPVQPRPAQLPADVTAFVARTDLAVTLAQRLTAGGTTAPAAVAVSGAAGSGKTTLAVHVAHRVKDGFPDGQLFADLRGEDGPLDPAEVLARFLRALGEDARTIPPGLDERAALFRVRTAGRRLLVLLDNAAGEPQLRPLMPADPGCAVLVTSRRRIAALLGAHEADLGVFDPVGALDLLRTMLGPARVDAERADCLAVAQRCGYLPLAIRIAAARLAARPHWPVARLAERLADESSRLDVLSLPDLAIRSSLALSVNALDPADRQLFARLGGVEAAHLPSWAAAALLDLPAADAEEPIERLAEARLVEAEPSSPARYHLHDLVRSLARERLADDAGAAAAQERFLGGWLTLADAAYDRLPGGFRRAAPQSAPRWSGWRPAELDELLGDPAVWCEGERTSLVAAVRQAASAGHTELAWNLAVTLARFFELREHLDDWQSTHETALRACLAAGDRVGEAYLLRGLGEVRLNRDHFAEALGFLRPALAIMRELADLPGEGAVLRAAGTAHRMLGEEAEAMAALDRARIICAETGDQVGQAQVLHNIGAVHRRAGRLDDAEAAYRAALAIFEERGDPFGRSFTLCSLGLIAGRRPERVDEADRCLRLSLELSREFGYRRGEAIALGNLGDLYQRTGRPAAAAAELVAAITICREIGDDRGEAIELRRLGESYLDLGRHAAARSVLQRGLALARELGLDEDRREALALLGRTEEAPPPT